MVGKIFIPENGKEETIGSYVDESGKLVLGVELIDVIAQVEKLPPTVDTIEVHIKGPGGLVDVGDSIYDYLESLKKTKVVNTVQDGDLGSIDTKIFMVGQNRVRDPRFKFVIHNPWNDPGPGDSNHHAANLEQLLASEDALRKFYTKITGISSEGLKPLMDQETDISPEQSVALHFATSLKQISVMAKIGDKAPTLAQRVAALYKSVTGNEIKAETPKALDIPLADGSVLSVSAENEDSMVGADAMLNGQPAPDRDYNSAPDEEGMSDVISVKGGKVTAVTEQPMAQAPNARIDAIEKSLSQLTDAVAALVEANKAQVQASLKEVEAAQEEKLKAAIMALKTEIGTTHEPKRAAVVYADTVDKTPKGHRSIAQVMAEKAEARKNNK